MKQKQLKQSIKSSPPKVVNKGDNHLDINVGIGEDCVNRCFGSDNPDFQNRLISQIGLSMPGGLSEQPINASLAILHSTKPANELEAMLVSQMAVTHNMMMRCSQGAMHSGATFEGKDMNLRHATKLSRTYIAQLETLQKLRGKSHQKITVQHVSVKDNAKAIIGDVSHGGGGENEKT